MKLSTTTVQKLMITDVNDLDPVAVYLEDLGPEYGKITITCFNDSWSYAWGSMGKGHDIRSFFLSCDEHYLSKKFSPQINHTVDDLDGLVEHARKYICKERRDTGFKKETARELYDLTEFLQEYHDNDQTEYRESMYRIFGDEWYDRLPQKSNHVYEYLCRVINTVKEALRLPTPQAT